MKQKNVHFVSIVWDNYNHISARLIKGAAFIITVLRHPAIKYDAELIKCRLPVSDRHSPFFRYVFKCKVDQFKHGFIAGKVTSVLRDFTQ